MSNFSDESESNEISDQYDYDTAAEISDTDSTNTAVEFWDHRKMKFRVTTDEDGQISPEISGESPIVWKFPLKRGDLVVEFYPIEMYILLYGQPRAPDKEWLLRAQVRIWASSTDKRDQYRVIDADLFEFGNHKIRFNLKCRDVTRIKFDMCYVFETNELQPNLEDLDNILAIQPSLTSKELLEKFYWSQRYKMENLRRASLLRVETSCKHLVLEMREMPEYQLLGAELRKAINERLEDGWVKVKERLSYFEATSNAIREILFENGKILGGPVGMSETSLATTFGINSEEILGDEKSIEIIQEAIPPSEYIIPVS